MNVTNQVFFLNRHDAFIDTWVKVGWIAHRRMLSKTQIMVTQTGYQRTKGD